ncbi:type IV conjugative transfer system coupling protein TraD [Enterobacter hormaechei]|jgi:type IV conjugative transfer system coupling protein TraD|uniref:Type IV conjugative transfer system coupling protein TraD n=5 Tax=Enterobacter TaxID=547 RepID=A0A0H3CUE9_ENTCC|nr:MULTISPECIES: type IV conjugative transfer system coupling protein TraD [Enterobacterales]ATZ71373.1 IncF plasmid conjugative transfer protein TraD [Enterobacter sp. HP19]EBF7542233.1 type IV conjugative transfer system coupling protein TraD [Salmonella enterica]EBF7899976.1 type IV conjugative transfer system coupling protein TraD [Salmonella enterica subsp. enterica serovar Worthington]ECL3879546.1 type IV conjugative transfer system coupling protein TraD [Salmonella enterica subsp. enteri
MSFAGKNLTQGGQMTAYRWRMFIQVNNWIGFWIFILFAVLTTAIFLWRIPQEALDNGSLWWFASINSSFIDLMPASGTPKIYDVHYWYAPTATAMVLKMTLPQIYTDPYMQAMGDQCLRELHWAAGASGLFSMVVFIAVTWFIANIGRKESEDEYLSGMQLTDKPAEVNKLLRQNGELSDLRVADLHMVKRAEVMNFLMHGTINVGKSTIIRWLLDYIRKRGDRAIIYDSGCTFTETHYNPSTDFILNAHDERCANWQMWGECIDAVDYDNLAASLIPVEGESDPFWVSSSRTICADLAIRMSVDPDRSIEKFLKTLLSLSMKSLREYLVNTPSANLVEEKIEKTAISIRSVVTNYAKALRFLQGLDDGTKPPFTIREWMTQERYDNSWLFISTQARHRKSVRPLISLWVSLATLLLQSMGENSERRVWFILDEAPSLQRIPELAETLAEARKFGGCFVLGMQNMAQLVHVYGRELAKSIFDLMNTRMYGRSPSAEMAKVVEEELGNQRKRKIREQNSYGLDQVRDGVSLGKDEVNNPIVDYEQIMRLPNLNFYVRLPGEYPVVRLKLKYRPFKKRHAGLIERNIRDALSPELERVIQENERAAAIAGLTFPTGDEVLEKGSETSSADDGPAPVSSAGASGSQATPVVEKVARTRMEEPKPSRSAAPERKPVPVREPDISRKEPAVTENHRPVTAPVTGDKKDNVVSLRPSKPAPNHQKGTASLNPEIPAALQKIRSRTQLDIPSEPAAAGALGMLKRRLSTGATSDGGEDQASENAGESMNLDMKVTALPDGGLSLTTAGKSVTPQTPDEAHSTHRKLAQEEENILLHRHADDPGYDENDHYYYDREPEL